MRAREKVAANSFGRPKLAYHVLSRTTKQVNAALEDPKVELVAIAFSRLRHVCRFEKGGQFAPKSENKTYHHFTPIKGQASALIRFDKIKV